MRTDMDQKVAEILKPEQVDRLKQIQFQVEGARALRNPEVVKELGLSEDQTAKLTSMQREVMEKMREAFQGGGQEMTPEQRQERRAKMTEMRKEMETKAMEILTPEQKEKFQKMQGRKIEIELPAFGGRGPRAGGRNRQPANQ